MGLRINTNVAALGAQKSLSQTNEAQARSIGKLATGSRIVRAADDAAGLAISEHLKAKIRGVRQAERNTNDGISMIQTAEGGLNETSSILTRLRELAIQTSSDTLGDKERELTDLEVQSMKSEIERISNVTEFNGKKLLNGIGGVYDIQVGVNNNDKLDRIKYDASKSNATLSGLNLKGVRVNTKEDSWESLEILDDAITNVSGQRATLGAAQNRLASTVRNLQTFIENLSAANSRIRDTDFASEISNNARLGILLNAGVSVLSQANANGSQALRLLS